jgi:hypothetical protein
MISVLNWIFVMLVSIVAIFFAQTARAEISPGVRAGVYFDAESAFVGGEVEIGLTEDWRFVPNIEYVFVDEASLTTFNFDLQYTIRTDYSVEFWAGGGPAILHFNPENDQFDSDTDIGANIFFGVGFPLRDAQILPYVQPKLILSDDVEFSLAFGVRF